MNFLLPFLVIIAVAKSIMALPHNNQPPTPPTPPTKLLKRMQQYGQDLMGLSGSSYGRTSSSRSSLDSSSTLYSLRHMEFVAEDVLDYNGGPSTALLNFQMLLSSDGPNKICNAENLDISFSLSGRKLQILGHNCTIDFIHDHVKFQKARAHFDAHPAIGFSMLFFKRDFSDKSYYERFRHAHNKLVGHNSYIGAIVDPMRYRYVIFLRD